MKPDRHVALLGGAAHHVPVLHRDISEGLHLVEVQISSSLVHDSQCVLSEKVRDVQRRKKKANNKV